MEYRIRQGNIDDAKALAAVEAECFPQAEAATAGEIRDRLSVYPNHFLLLYRDGKLVGFIDGMTTELMRRISPMKCMKRLPSIKRMAPGR